MSFLGAADGNLLQRSGLDEYELIRSQIVLRMPTLKREATKIMPKEGTMNPVIRMNTTPISTTMPVKLATAAVDGEMNPRRTRRLSAISP